MKASLIKCTKSFGFAWKGIVFVVSRENNMLYHLIATVAVIIAGAFVKLSLTEWALIIICIGMVWMAEFFNTAIEKLVDLVSPQFNEKAGLVKDIASGAVLVTAITALIVGLIVFAGHL